jgi:crossover junction endodeoxyribonuclease RuvC
MEKHKSPRFLALDLGTKMGWAMESRHVRIYGTEDFSTKRFEGGGMRYIRFQEWLESQSELAEIDRIYFEEVRRHAGTAAAHVYGGFMATLTSWCEKNKIPYESVPVKTIKKFITGKGNASKQMVIDAVKARGFNVDNDNEADAIALMLYVKEK